MFTPSLADDGDDVYQPTMDLEEGSGDNEEELQCANTRGNVQVPTNLEGINLTTNTQPSAPNGSRFTVKRKRVEGSDASKKKKLSSSKQISDAVSVTVIASKDRANAFKKISNNDVPVTVSDVVTELLTIPEIADNHDFCLRCYNMMMHQICRDVFIALKRDKDDLIDWLRHHAYKTPSWQELPKH